MNHDNNTIFEYAERTSAAHIKITHDQKHHSYKVVVSKTYMKNKAVAEIIIPEDEFPFTRLP
jgi:hypothetical protein